jgi:hypothetical protein
VGAEASVQVSAEGDVVVGMPIQIDYLWIEEGAVITGRGINGEASPSKSAWDSPTARPPGAGLKSMTGHSDVERSGSIMWAFLQQ